MIVVLQALFFFRDSIFGFIGRYLGPYYKSLTFRQEDRDRFEETDSEEWQVYAEFDDEKGVVFIPAVGLQRYAAVGDVLREGPWAGNILKVVDLGCNDASFIRHLIEIKGVQTILGVDLSAEALQNTKSLDNIDNQELPLKIVLFEGNAADPDYRLIGCDAVIAIELIEHMFTHDLDRIVHTIFGFIKPWVIVITTPNHDFNVLFKNLEPNGLRRTDHIFEWSREQFNDWSSNIVLRYPDYSVTCKGIGPGPPETEHYGCCSQMAIFSSNNYKKQHELTPNSLSTCTGNVKIPAVSSFDALLYRINQEYINSNNKSGEIIMSTTNSVSEHNSSTESFDVFNEIPSSEECEIQCNLSLDNVRNYLMVDETYAIDKVLTANRNMDMKVYRIEDVSCRLNCTDIKVKTFSNEASKLLNPCEPDLNYATDKGIKKIPGNCPGGNDSVEWHNFNWGENAPFWNKYYKIVKSIEIPIKHASEESMILDKISNEINRLLNILDTCSDGMDCNKLEIPLEHLMVILGDITSDADHVLDLLEWNGYTVEDKTLTVKRAISEYQTASIVESKKINLEQIEFDIDNLDVKDSMSDYLIMDETTCSDLSLMNKKSVVGECDSVTSPPIHEVDSRTSPTLDESIFSDIMTYLCKLRGPDESEKTKIANETVLELINDILKNSNYFKYEEKPIYTDEVANVANVNERKETIQVIDESDQMCYRNEVNVGTTFDKLLKNDGWLKGYNQQAYVAPIPKNLSEEIIIQLLNSIPNNARDDNICNEHIEQVRNCPCTADSVYAEEASVVQREEVCDCCYDDCEPCTSSGVQYINVDAQCSPINSNTSFHVINKKIEHVNEEIQVTDSVNNKVTHAGKFAKLKQCKVVLQSYNGIRANHIVQYSGKWRDPRMLNREALLTRLRKKNAPKDCDKIKADERLDAPCKSFKLPSSKACKSTIEEKPTNSMKNTKGDSDDSNNLRNHYRNGRGSKVFKENHFILKQKNYKSKIKNVIEPTKIELTSEAKSSCDTELINQLTEVVSEKENYHSKSIKENLKVFENLNKVLTSMHRTQQNNVFETRYSTVVTDMENLLINDRPISAEIVEGLTVSTDLPAKFNVLHKNCDNIEPSSTCKEEVERRTDEENDIKKCEADKMITTVKCSQNKSNIEMVQTPIEAMVIEADCQNNVDSFTTSVAYISETEKNVNPCLSTDELVRLEYFADIDTTTANSAILSDSCNESSVFVELSQKVLPTFLNAQPSSTSIESGGTVIDKRLGKCNVDKSANQKNFIASTDQSTDSFISCDLNPDIIIPSWLFCVIDYLNDQADDVVELQTIEIMEEMNGSNLINPTAGAGDGRGIHSEQSTTSSGNGASIDTTSASISSSVTDTLTR